VKSRFAVSELAVESRDPLQEHNADALQIGREQVNDVQALFWRSRLIRVEEADPRSQSRGSFAATARDLQAARHMTLEMSARSAKQILRGRGEACMTVVPVSDRPDERGDIHAVAVRASLAILASLCASPNAPATCGDASGPLACRAGGFVHYGAQCRRAREQSERDLLGQPRRDGVPDLDLGRAARPDDRVVVREGLEPLDLRKP
jgi:hypothetical protein